MTDPTEENLLEAVKEALLQDGKLGHFKSDLRKAVISILNRTNPDKKPPQVPEETSLINELLREYLVWNGYIYSEQLLVAESGHGKVALTRDNLATKLGVLDDSKTTKIPLLYYIVSAFQSQDMSS